MGEVVATAELAGLEIETDFILEDLGIKLISVIISTITTSMSTFHIGNLGLTVDHDLLVQGWHYVICTYLGQRLRRSFRLGFGYLLVIPIIECFDIIFCAVKWFGFKHI